MSSSLTPKQVPEQALRKKAELERSIKYLQDQLWRLLRERCRNLRKSNSNSKHNDYSLVPSKQEDDDKPFASSSNAFSRGGERRYHKRQDGGGDDFRVDIPEFEG